MLLEIAVIPVAVAFVFPYEAVGFRAEKRERGSRTSFAFVGVYTVRHHRMAVPAEQAVPVICVPVECRFRLQPHDQFDLARVF